MFIFLSWYPEIRPLTREIHTVCQSNVLRKLFALLVSPLPFFFARFLAVTLASSRVRVIPASPRRLFFKGLRCRGAVTLSMPAALIVLTRGKTPYPSFCAASSASPRHISGIYSRFAESDAISSFRRKSGNFGSRDDERGRVIEITAVAADTSCSVNKANGRMLV